MRIAMFSWETLHSIAVGGGAAHVTELAAALQRRGEEVHVFTRPGCGVSRIDGVWYHYCPFNLKQDFVDETQDMCRSFVWHFFQKEEQYGHFDIVHAHDWLTASTNAWIKNGRPDPSTVLTM
jgi:glycogen synthase